MPHSTHIRRAFGDAAPAYAAHAALQQRVAARVAKLALRYIPRGAVVMDAGAGTGFVAQALHNAYPTLLALDSAYPMCRAAYTHYPAGTLCADMASLPVADRALGGIVSSLALQWTDPREVFTEWGRAVAPGAHAIIATFGEQTLHELASAFRRVDGDARINAFPAREELLAHAAQAGWRIIECSSETEQQHFATLSDLLHSLKAIGATARDGARRGLTTPAFFRQVETHYRAAHPGTHDLPATWQLYYLILKRESDHA